jgi:D-3-phosphoglycerate dehydrogenase
VLTRGVIRNAVNMPSIDSAALKVLGPYLDLGDKLGTLVQQIAPARIVSLHITYWGKIVDLDANAVTRSIQHGWLRRISGSEANEVNAPYLLKQLGVEVQVTKSNSDVDFTELIEVEAVDEHGQRHRAHGTLLGKAQSPRIVDINGREVEVAAKGKLLVLENQDQPGMVGEVGTLLGESGVNIASMSLSRLEAGETAYMVVRVDSEPSAEARAQIKNHPRIKLAKFVQL